MKLQQVLSYVRKAVDDYQGILRASVASAGNDHRLGANEAPPAIISVYLGDQLGALVDCIVKGGNYVPVKAEKGSIGIPESPIFPKDATDRNRTSPFAFTGNKFEFRMLGSQANVADPNIVLNTIVADAFSSFADELEKAGDVEKAANKITERELKAHYRIIFNEDGYGPEWEPEAAKRGLLNNKNTADAVPVFFEKKNIDVFVRNGVYTEQEAVARGEISLENYVKTINIEALTMLDMVRQDIIPAVSDYVAVLCSNVAAKQACGDMPCVAEKVTAKRLADLNDGIFGTANLLQRHLGEINTADVKEASKAMAHVIVPDMQALRGLVDEAEKVTASDYWPYPS